MANESREDRIFELIARWEEARLHGKGVTPERLCKLCPELLDDLKARIASLGEVDRASSWRIDRHG